MVIDNRPYSNAGDQVVWGIVPCCGSGANFDKMTLLSENRNEVKRCQFCGGSFKVADVIFDPAKDPRANKTLPKTSSGSTKKF